MVGGLHPRGAADGRDGLDLGHGANRLGGSALAQACGQFGNTVPDMERAEDLKAFFTLVQEFVARKAVLAYHDRSDGGLLVTALEMAFAGRCGLVLDIPDAADPLSWLFNEELGAVVQVAAEDADAVGPDPLLAALGGGEGEAEEALVGELEDARAGVALGGAIHLDPNASRRVDGHNLFNRIGRLDQPVEGHQ